MTLSTANSAQMVLPDAVGAAIRQLSSDSYNALNTCRKHLFEKEASLP